MIEKDLLTIPEFAEAAGKKKQGIYEQVKNEKSKLAPFVVLQGEKAFIKRQALKEVYGIEQAESQDSQEISQVSQADSQDFSQGNQDTSQDSQGSSQGGSQENQAESQGNSQESQGTSQAAGEPKAEQSIIVFLQKQLEEKDRQLAEKDKQIEKIQQLLDQEQKLHLSTKVLLMEYRKQEEPQEAQEAAPMETTEEPPQEKDQEPKKKRNWFVRWFWGED